MCLCSTVYGTRNEINSIAGDIFTHFYEQPNDKKASQVLKPKDEEYFLNFILQVNNFAGNMIKFMAGEVDLNFIGLNSA